MKAWMLAAISGAPELVTVTFTSNATWPAPVGVGQLATLAGRGQEGQPEYQGEYGYTVTTETKTYNSSGQLTSTQTGTGTFPYESPPSSDYCEGGQSSNGGSYETCYYFAEYSDYSPATTGANSSAFGYTFPGGVGGPASTLTYGNVPVTPGNPYSIVVPAGGSVTITYYK